MHVIHTVPVIDISNNTCNYPQLLDEIISLRKSHQKFEVFQQGTSKNIINHKCIYITLSLHYKCTIRINTLNTWDFIYTCIWPIANSVKQALTHYIVRIPVQAELGKVTVITKPLTVCCAESLHLVDFISCCHHFLIRI